MFSLLMGGGAGVCSDGLLFITVVYRKLYVWLNWNRIVAPISRILLKYAGTVECDC